MIKPMQRYLEYIFLTRAHGSWWSSLDGDGNDDDGFIFFHFHARFFSKHTDDDDGVGDGDGDGDCDDDELSSKISQVLPACAQGRGDNRGTHGVTSRIIGSSR